MGLPKGSGLTLRSRHPSGKRNLITDVPGVRVGHVTIQEGEINTGVTAILPHGGNLFKDKVMAAALIMPSALMARTISSLISVLPSDLPGRQ